MQANEFEKNIRNKMEGFGLVPDGEVWEQVSMRIEKEKKKRRILFYWAFTGLALLTGTSAFWFINSENTTKPAVNRVTDLSGRENYEIKPGRPNSSFSLNKGSKVQMKKKLAYFKKSDRKQVPEILLKNNDASIRQSEVENKEVAIKKVRENNHINNEEKQLLKDLAPHRFYNPNASTAKVDTAVKDSSINKKAVAAKDILPNTIAKKTIRTKAAGKKWNFGFTVYSGISNNIAGMTLFKNSNTYYDYSPGALTSTGNYNSNINTLSNFKTGFSFGLGIFLNKPLTKKVSLSVGLDYHLYQAKSRVGKNVNSATSFYDSVSQTVTSLQRYYNTGDSLNYSNKYRFVELPVIFLYQINKNQKKPVTVSAGISPGYLVSSNALYANPSANVYYVDKQKFHHLQLSGQAGFSFPIIGSLKYLLSAGPAVQYAFTNITKATAGTSQHIFFTGIKANIIFK